MSRAVRSYFGVGGVSVDSRSVVRIVRGCRAYDVLGYSWSADNSLWSTMGVEGLLFCVVTDCRLIGVTARPSEGSVLAGVRVC